MQKIFIVLGILAFIFVGWLLFFQPKPIPQVVAPVSSKPTVVAVYEGVTPCADCPGITETLTLYSDKSYSEIDVYQERNVTNEVKGAWSETQSTPGSPQAHIYQLTPIGANSKTSYLIRGETLVPLDDSLKELPSPYNAPLTKKAN